MPFGLFGGGSDAEANNDVNIAVMSSPVITIDNEGLAAGNIEAATIISGELRTGLMSFSSTLAFIAVIGAGVVILGRR